MSRFQPASAASAVVAVALAAIAFGAGGGTQTGRLAPVEVAVMLAAGSVLAVSLVSFETRRPIYGGLALTLLALLTILTGLSMSWSVAPGLSFLELGRTLTYLAVFALGVVAARHLPGGAQRMAIGLLGAAVAVCGWALATRMLPATLGSDVFGARLGEPFDYWNALGAMGAMAVPAALWLATRRDGGPGSTALAYPALGVLLLTVMLTQSRGALVTAVLAVLSWLAFVPLRLRVAPVLVAVIVIIGPIAAWALSEDAFTADLQPLAGREAVAGTFTLMVAAGLAVLAAAGFAVGRIRERIGFSLVARRRMGIAMAASIILAGLIVFGSVVTSDRGLGGRVQDLTAKTSSAPASGASRLGSASSSRGEYWRQAYKVFKERPLIGRGADGFSLARLPYREGFRGADHAHGYIPQVMADLGLLGLGVVLCLLGAWLLAAGRTLGVRRRRGPSGPNWIPERIALCSLTLCVAAYGLLSAIDWTWFIPGPTAAAMMAAGFVAGRGPLAAPTPTSGPLRLQGLDPMRMIGAAAVIVTALLCAWAAYQPQRSASAIDRAVSLAEQGKNAEAIRQANRARELDPYSPDPLYAKATAVAGAGRPVPAYRLLEQSVAEHPRDPETWLRLGQFELDELDLPTRTLQSAGAAQVIDPKSNRAAQLRGAAQAALAESAVPPPPAP